LTRVSNLILAKNNSEFIYYSRYKEIGSASSSNYADKSGDPHSAALPNAKASAKRASIKTLTKESSGLGRSRNESDACESLLVKRGVQHNDSAALGSKTSGNPTKSKRGKKASFCETRPQVILVPATSEMKCGELPASCKIDSERSIVSHADHPDNNSLIDCSSNGLAEGSSNIVPRGKTQHAQLSGVEFKIALEQGKYQRIGQFNQLYFIRVINTELFINMERG